MSYELIQKPAFFKSFTDLEKADQKKVRRAVEALRRGPFGAKSRKIFKERFGNLYRYRVGDYRLCYTVGTGCVSLLRIGHRGKIYQELLNDPELAATVTADLSTARPEILPTAVDDPPPVSLPEGADRADDAMDQTDGGAGETPPPASGRDLLPGLLELWGVAAEHREAILACGTAEELFDLDLPDEVLEQVLHVSRPPGLREIVEQPSYELQKPADLERYAEGELSGFLLHLDAEQRRAADRHVAGPVLVRGGPGTGKSVVALYRIRNLVRGAARGRLFGGRPPRVLFATYTKALTRASEQLLGSLLGEEEMRWVEVRTLDSLAREVAGPGLPGGRVAGWKMRDLTEEARRVADLQGPEQEIRAARRALERLEPEYLAEELDWVLDGRGLETMEAYLAANRAGRGIGLDEGSRRAVWAVYQAWRRLLRQRGALTYTQVQGEALKRAGELSADEKYDVVVVDEAQDLKPVGIRLALAVCKSPRGFYLTADEGQSIYGRGFSWKEVSRELRLQGRSTVLRRNYRSTARIQAAARQLLQAGGLDDPESSAVAVRQGPPPILLEHRGDPAEEIARQLRAWAQELRVPVWTGAVLARTHQVGEELAAGLARAGLPAQWVKSAELELDARHVKVMTIHAAKGLEFPMLVVAGLAEGVLPLARRPGQDPEDYAELLRQERRLLHVALTRAMRRLLVAVPAASPSPFVADLDTGLWDRRR